MIISIHQPHYFLSFAQIKKIIASDVFVYFDDVQLPQGKSCVHRCKVKCADDTKWLNVKVSNKSSIVLINEGEVSDYKFIDDHKNKLINYYPKSNGLDFILNLLDEIKIQSLATLSDINVFLTMQCLSYLGFSDVRCIPSSEMKARPADYGTTGDRIVQIVKELDGDIYLTGDGPGSKRYLDVGAFTEYGIEVKYFNFEHPHYRQGGLDFVCDLSVIDLLCNEGPYAKDILESC